MFSEFPAIETAEWHKKIEKDSKGLKTFDDLAWHTPEGLTVAPFYRNGEVAINALPNLPKTSWQLHEIIVVDDAKQANKTALEALADGANSLQFVLNNKLTINDLRIVLDSVFVEMIHIGFSGQWVWRHADLAWQLYAELLAERGVLSPTIACTLEADPLNVEVLHTLSKDISNFLYIKIVNVYANGNVKEQLTNLVKSTQFLLEKTPELLTDSCNRIVWSLPTANSFMLEIAKLRAARRVWAEKISSKHAPFIHAFTAPMTQTNDIHYNKIMLTTQGMSAIIGQADRVTITPSDVKTNENSSEKNANARRIARNVQHILKLESHFDKVQDPSAGSYYIEHLTNELAK